MRQNGIHDNHTLSRLASIGQVSAGIAHEVRNPLTAVKGFLQLMQQETPHVYLDIACSELERAISTLQNLLNVSKPDLDEEAYVPINMCVELESILQLFQDQIYRVEIDKQLRNTDTVIYGRRNQLKKAFFNLLKNAHEAIVGEGRITVHHARIGERVVIRIGDTGVGIPAEKLELLGTPFFTTKDEGTGMGLTQVFSTVYQHGGKIEVKSAHGAGTEFEIQLPVRNQHDTGVVELNLQMIEGQSFLEFYEVNKQHFFQRMRAECANLYEEIYRYEVEDIDNKLDLFADQLVILLTHDQQHELIVLAQRSGRESSQSDLNYLSIMEWFTVFRKVYWDFLYNFHKDDEQLTVRDLFAMERRINISIDQFVNHYAAKYTEYRNEMLRSHRDLIDDLTVPIIPLSSSMAVLPILGTMDTHRAKKIQEHTLNQIAHLKIERIIIDLSGVAYLDTAVVQHLFRIVEGISLLGCRAVVTGIRPEIANTMIELGISLTERVETKASLQQALEVYGMR
ncbi:ATP-binding protein [Tumebacillus permanentifrigoris]|uniref:histidine kinase n=1 Tax=Tumebacillus permanentifrigoris TaxID=378543 RepID=A0A316DDJ7_9BACL|nr:ATP-binding protein [Tumebacillus permanentifrigoris]PWK15698.1 rsbT co-antagonist protein RsbR [Tumebacillus permanentifrigoris]